jgi:hypothetical protein
LGVLARTLVQGLLEELQGKEELQSLQLLEELQSLQLLEELQGLAFVAEALACRGGRNDIPMPLTTLPKSKVHMIMIVV